MPKFSIVIAVYNNAEYLASCLESIVSQSFTDWEAIVVIDASPDNAFEIANRFAAEDERIHVIDKEENEGLHLARRSGTFAAAGSYITYLDGDDELAPGCLEKLDIALKNHPCDLLRFGAEVIPEGVSESSAIALEEMQRRSFAPMTGRQSVHLSFEEDGGYVQDWRTWCNVLTKELALNSFSKMTDKRLDRAEDAYEFLAFASNCVRQVTRTDIIGYRYFFGRGITGDGSIPAETFIEHAQEFQDCIQEIRAYALGFHKFDLEKASVGARTKLVEMMFTDWDARVPENEKTETAMKAAEVFGKEVVAAELMRISRDKAYNALVNNRDFDPDADYTRYSNLGYEIAFGCNATSRYIAMESASRGHIDDIKARTSTNARKTKMLESPIKILVAGHKPAATFDSNILIPVQVGCANTKNRIAGFYYDDEGENISEQNPCYCELTAQYWAWKNLDAKYVGLCHYRRYFSFSDKSYPENNWGEIISNRIDDRAQRKFGLTDEDMQKIVSEYDIITTINRDIRDFPDDSSTPIEQWNAAPRLYDEDLINLLATAIEMHPDYAKDVEMFANGNYSRFCNMFIMRKDIFDSYCEWLFPILKRFCSITDMTHYSKETLRTPGHLSERLLNIFVNHYLKENPQTKYHEVQCVHFLDTSPNKPSVVSDIRIKHECKEIIPVVFAADTKYIPMVGTTIFSMLENASIDYHYDVRIFTRNLSWPRFIILKEFIESSFKNASLNLFDVSKAVANYDLTTNNAHISLETYFRFIVQDALPNYDKVIYLDSDLIIEGDISKLFNQDLGDNLIGAVRDIDYLGNLNKKDGVRMKYTKEVLEMSNPYDYFQAGVLALNTNQLRKEIPVDVWLKEGTNNEYIYNDQDILNKYCEGRVVFFDPEWNVMMDCDHRIENYFSFAPANIYDEFLDARSHEKVIHYAGFQKPWLFADCDRHEKFWKYARRTPFNEELLSMMMEQEIINYLSADRHASAVSEGNPIRKIVDPILPPGTQRRETVKAIARKVRGLE